MLEKIREGSQGTIAKVILGAVILSFALAGIGSYLGRPAESLAAVVNGDKISNQALEAAVQSERQRLQQQFGDSFDAIAGNPAFMAQIRRTALEQLVTRQLLDQTVAKNGLSVGDAQVRQAILELPAFQVDGQFNNDRYLSLINRQGYSAAAFRETMRQDLSRSQFLTGITDSEFVLPGEVKRTQTLMTQTRDIRYWSVDTQKLAEAITPTEEQVQAYFDKNQFSYQQPEMVSVEYVELNADQLAEGVEITESDIKTYYTDNQDLFLSAEERRASHILVSSVEQAAKLKAELEAGADFAELAKQHSQDTFTKENGGDLDWFTKGVMVEAFDDAVFNMTKEGAISEPVTSSFGVHLIKLTGVRPAKAQELADVSAEIKETLTRNKALELYYQKQEQVTNLAFELPDSLDELAQEAELSIKQTALFSRSNAPTSVAHPKVIEAIFSDPVLRDNMNSDAIEIAEGHLLVVRLKEHQEARSKTLNEVKPEVAQAVKHEEAVKQANDIANSMLATLNKGEQLIIEADQPVDVLSQAEVTRNSVAVEPAIRDHVFAMAKPADKAQYSKISSGTSVAVIALDAVKEGSTDASDEALKQNLEQQVMSQAYNELVKVLRANAEIKYPAPKEEG